MRSISPAEGGRATASGCEGDEDGHVEIEVDVMLCRSRYVEFSVLSREVSEPLAVRAPVSWVQCLCAWINVCGETDRGASAAGYSSCVICGVECRTTGIDEDV